ncbi:MAG: DNA adenine methylase [Actinobacteria bacterium]|nr:DNA adenine methylase [Actinomycetota bacterium]
MFNVGAKLVGTKIKPVLRYPGAKWTLAKWICDHLPEHITYLEPFFGSGAVFFSKERSKIETINDIDANVINLFRVIRETPDELARLIDATPWSREEYNASINKTGDPVEDARRFLVRCWMARAADYDRNGKSGWRNNTIKPQGSFKPDTWRKLPERILSITDRLKQVQIEMQPAIELIPRYNAESVLIYADPPYPLSTRCGAMYAHEMTDEDHIELLDALDAHPGPVVLSGYSCDLYNDRLSHWMTRTARAVADGGKQAVEVLWLNGKAAATIRNPSLFEE